MKILNLKMKNFKAIKVAMKSNSIEIDFTKSENKICILIGPNGSGKTTILSHLQPFADVGNLDVRSGEAMIIDGKEGYKELTIDKDGSIYIIKHFYYPHKDKNHSVKSYIEKDGNELNMNGNVTSFKEIIKNELYIEPDYLKLVRLGTNVDSLISLSTSERKNFMSKMLDYIGVYLDLYKSVNTKLRRLDDMISHSIDKEKKLNIIDKDEYQKDIDKLSHNISILENKYMEYNNRLSILKESIKELLSVSELKDMVKEYGKKLLKMKNVIDNNSDILNSDIDYYYSEIDRLTKEKNDKENKLNINNELITKAMDYNDIIHENIRTYNIQLEKELGSEKEIERLNKILTDMRGKMNEYLESIENLECKLTKDELSNFIIFLNNSQNMIRNSYDLGKAVVSKVIDLMKHGKNVNNYINKHLIEIDEHGSESNSIFINEIISEFYKNESNEILTNCKEDTCPAKKLYHQIKGIISSRLDDKEKKKDETFYHDMKIAYLNISTILNEFKSYADIINNLPEEIKKFFVIENIYNRISNLDYIFEQEKLNDLLSVLTDKDNYDKLEVEYNNTENLLNKFISISNYDIIKKNIKIWNEHLHDNEIELREKRKISFDLKEEIKEINNTIESYSDITFTIDKYNEISDNYNKYEKELEKVLNTNDEINTILRDSELTKYTINEDKSRLEKMKLNLLQYDDLRKEIKKFNSIYDEMIYVKNSLSSKEGIPLKFIGNYLRNTEEITNELLDIAYDGNIKIEKFDISASEFSIPFINKGVYIPDVKLASQGELSFLSIALSFALISQTLKKYNIMLFDEIDGGLDVRNREKFIAILLNQIDRIKSEQTILISHNNMFTSYPVDILDFSFSDNREYTLGNYIDVIKH